MSDAQSYDNIFMDTFVRATKYDLSSDQATTAIKNLKLLSECRIPTPEPKPETVPEPTSVMDRIKAGLNGVWESETTRVMIKASGAFAGVALVAWTTVHRDHVITRDALSQANQRFS